MHIHAVGQAADIVMALDRDRWSAGEADAFDHIGIERTLRQEIGAADFLRFLFEHVDEFPADEFALLFRVGDAGKARHEARLGIDHHQRNIIMVAEEGFDLLPFVHPQQAVVDKDTSQLRANGFVDQDRGDRGIDSAGQAANDAA